MRWLAAIFLALVAVPAASGKAVPRPCSLVTDAQVAHVLGQKVQYHEGQRGMCSWHMQPLGNFTSASAQIDLFVVPQDGARFRKEAQTDPFAAPVKDVGAIAYWTPGSNVKELVAWQSGYAVTVYATLVINQLRTEKAIAALVLPRLS